MAVINIPQYETQVTDFCVAALEAFSQEHSNIKVSNAMLYSFPNYGTLIFCLDTLANSASRSGVNAEPDSAQASVVCPNFAFFEWRRMDIEQWSEAYESEWIDGSEPLEIRTISGESIFMGKDEGDETLNKPVFDLLTKAMHNMTFHPVMKSLNREQHLHLGVQIEDSIYSEYWTLSNRAAL
jgi:hypothetical protein